MTKWIISLDPSKVLGHRHLQVRTADQFSSFAILITKSAILQRTKAANGKADVFTLIADGGTTMNVLGEIEYQGIWPKT